MTDTNCPFPVLWEVARTVVAPPSSVVKCLWEVFVRECGVLFLSCCVCVSVSGVLFSFSVCVCDLLILSTRSSGPTILSWRALVLIYIHRCLIIEEWRGHQYSPKTDINCPFLVLWEVARTVVAPSSRVVKCLWEVFVWGCGLFVLVVCVCRCRCRGCCSLSVCVCMTC